MRNLVVYQTQLLFVILTFFGQVDAGQFRGFVSGDLTDPKNWSGFSLPSTDEVSNVFAQNYSALTITKDFTTKLLLLNLNPDYTTFDLNGNTLHADLFSNRSTNILKTLELHNGTIVGRVDSAHATIFRNLVFSGSFESQINFPIVYSDNILDNVQANITQWSRTVIQNLDIIHESTVSAGYLGANRLVITDTSSLSTNNLSARNLIIDAQARIDSNESFVNQASVSGPNAFADLGRVTNLSNLRLSVSQGAVVRMNPTERSTFGSEPGAIGNITVDGVGSKLFIDESLNRIMTIEANSSINEPFIKLTNGAFMETSGAVSLKEITGGLNVMNSTFHGNLINTRSIVRLDDGIIQGDSFWMNGGRLTGSGIIDVASIVPSGGLINPDGELIFTGSFSGVGTLEFDILNSINFDRITIEGNLLAAQFVRLNMHRGFRASVGDAIEFLQVDGNFLLGPALVTNMSIVGLPAGYSVEKVLTPHSLGIRITAVPEASTFALLAIAGIGLTVFSRMKRHLPIALVDTIYPVRHRSA